MNQHQPESVRTARGLLIALAACVPVWVVIGIVAAVPR